VPNQSPHQAERGKAILKVGRKKREKKEKISETREGVPHKKKRRMIVAKGRKIARQTESKVRSKNTISYPDRGRTREEGNTITFGKKVVLLQAP